MFGFICAVPILYYLSLGPVGWLCNHGYLPNEPFQTFYRELIVEDVCGAERYYAWWVPPEPLYCGASEMSVSFTPISSATVTNK